MTFKETCFIGVYKTVWKENFQEATQGLFHAFPLMFLNLFLMCYKHLQEPVSLKHEMLNSFCKPEI